MAATQAVALKHWARIIKRWPVDKLRRDHTSFQQAMQSRLQKFTDPSVAPAAATKSGAGALPATAPPKLDEQHETVQVNALYALLDNRFAKDFPVPEALRHPASNPDHYDALLQEIEMAPDRSWFQNAMLKFKNSFRFS